MNPSDIQDNCDVVDTLKKIVSIIKKHSAVYRIPPMAGLNTKFHKCTRKDKEHIKEYINRFKNPSLSYLNFDQHGQDSSDTQVFAMTLIFNANLSNQTFLSILSTFINDSNITEGRVALQTVPMKAILKA